MLLSRPLSAVPLVCLMSLCLAPIGFQGDTILLHGLIGVPENPESVAAAYEKQFQGSLAMESAPATPDLESRLLGAKTAVTGTIQVCLLSSVANGPCDPAYLSFAVMSLNEAGLDVYTVVRGNVQADPSAGADALAPEPANLGVFACLALLLFTLAREVNRFRAARRIRLQPFTRR